MNSGTQKTGRLHSMQLLILRTCVELTKDGVHEFFGYLLAKRLTGRVDGGSLAASGKVYTVLARLERAGLISCHWEEPNPETRSGRPVRRLYRVTAKGFQALVT